MYYKGRVGLAECQEHMNQLGQSEMSGSKEAELAQLGGICKYGGATGRT